MKAPLRHHLPWILSALAVLAAAQWLWPALLRETVQAHRQARGLEAALPDSATLRKRMESLAQDSVRIAALREAVSGRTVQAADPAARAVEECLTALAPAQWQIEKVQPDLAGSDVRIRLAGKASLPRIRDGLSRLEQGPLHVLVRTLSLRKEGGTLRFDLELLYAAKVTP